MALGTVLELVIIRLPFIPTDNSLDPTIESFKEEQMWFLQKFTGLADGDVLDESKYTGLLRVLLADLTAYEMVVRKAIETTGGVDGSAPASTKILTKGAAGPAEAEFDIAKAQDGVTIALKGEKLLPELLRSICTNSAVLNYALPQCPIVGRQPQPFQTFVRDKHGNLV